MMAKKEKKKKQTIEHQNTKHNIENQAATKKCETIQCGKLKSFNKTVYEYKK